MRKLNKITGGKHTHKQVEWVNIDEILPSELRRVNESDEAH